MINFNPISIIKLQNSQAISKPVSMGLKNDVFVRSTNNVSFKGSENHTFSEWAKENNFIENLEEILSNDENRIGKGFSHSAFAIPNCDEYILRTSSLNQKLKYSEAKIIDTEDKNLDVNIGQEVAMIEIPTEDFFPVKIEVLKKQKGKSIGVPPSQAIYVEETGELRKGELPYEAKERKKHYAKTIHQVAQLPVDAYEKLLADIESAAKAGYKFDHLNSNNLLVDEENSSINLIDMDKAKIPVNYGNVLYALTNINYLSTFTSSYDDNPMSQEAMTQAVGDTIDIIDKFMQAMQNKNLKLKQDDCSYEFFNLMNSIPMSFYCKTGDYHEKWQALKNRGIAV